MCVYMYDVLRLCSEMDRTIFWLELGPQIVSVDISRLGKVFIF